MRSVPSLFTARAVAPLGALVAVVLAAPASAAPVTVASVTPPSLAAPGTVVVHFHLTGAAVDSTSTLLARGTELASSSLSGEVESVEITGVTLQGAGSLAAGPLVVAGIPASCERGGIHPSSSNSSWVLSIPANASTDVVVTAKVPEGFAAQTPGVELVSGPLVPAGQSEPGNAKNDTTVAKIPRTGRSIDGLTLRIGRGAPAGTRVASGRLVPSRKGALVQIVGRAAKLFEGTPDPQVAAEKLGLFDDALRPIGGGLKLYAKTKTTAGGAFKVTFKAPPPGTVVVARTSGKSATDPGASCPIQLLGVAVAGH